MLSTLVTTSLIIRVLKIPFLLFKTKLAFKTEDIRSL